MKSKVLQYQAIIVVLALAVIPWLAVVSLEEMSLSGKGWLFLAFLGVAAGLYYLFTLVVKTLKDLHQAGNLGTFLVVAIPVFFVAPIVGASFFAGRSERDAMIVADLAAGAGYGIVAVGAVAKWMK